jgi:tetratricopeptide (TPR) repeat protein
MVARRTLVTGVLLAALAALSAPARSQDDPVVDAAAVYSSWYAANQAKDVAKAFQLAQEYVRKYPSGEQAEYLKKWVAGARGVLFNEAIQKKDVAKVIEIGQERLKEEPKDLGYLISLALTLRRQELFASPPNFTHAAEAVDFSRRGIALIEAGQLPPGADPAKWNKGDTLGWLHQNLAVVAVKQDKDNEALAEFEKSSQADADNPGLVAYNSLVSGSLHRQKYDAAVARFQALPEAERQGAEPGPTAKPILDEANTQADAAIRFWARFVAIAEAQGSYAETRDKITKTLTDLWTYRHPADPEGLKKLIEESRPPASPPPAQ